VVRLAAPRGVDWQYLHGQPKNVVSRRPAASRAEGATGGTAPCQQARESSRSTTYATVCTAMSTSVTSYRPWTRARDRDHLPRRHPVFRITRYTGGLDRQRHRQEVVHGITNLTAGRATPTGSPLLPLTEKNHESFIAWTLEAARS